MHNRFSRVMFLTIVGSALLGLTPVTDASEGEIQSLDTYILGPIENKDSGFVAKSDPVYGLLKIIKQPTKSSENGYECIFEPLDKKNKSIALLHVYEPGKLRVFYRPDVFNDRASLYLNAQGEGCLAINQNWYCDSGEVLEPYIATVSKQAAIAQTLTQSTTRQSEQKN